MKKMIIKLIAAGLSLVLAVTVAVMSSYAWLTLSDSPVANGIYIAVAGGNTILVAPDLTYSDETGTYHYPGVFDDTLNFSQNLSYQYLNYLGGLTPVSTTDGLNWVLPAYYEKNDPEVVSGAALNGELKSVSDFTVDSTLAYANLMNTKTEQIDQGSYIYLDFWVVSPGEDYRLRISTGDDSGGSFAIGLMEPQEADTDGDGVADSYVLSPSADSAAASVRVGFLVNEDTVTDESMANYTQSALYNDRYNRLKGIYQEPGEAAQKDYRFMIYEPNGTLHPDSSGAENGSYVITEPLSCVNSVIFPGDVSSNLTVQDTTSWIMNESGTQALIEQVFQGTVAPTGFRSSALPELNNSFYIDYLQGQVGAYVDKGSFFKRTDNLYVLANANFATAESLNAEREDPDSKLFAGATDDAYIVDLERNVPQRIRMFIWLEGQDADCTNDARGSGIAVSIELAGSNNGI